MARCEFPSDNHSRDTVEVWHGAAEPIILCGYHASQGLSAEMYQAIEGKRLAEFNTPLDAIPDEPEYPSDLDQFRLATLREAERTGGIVKITGPNSLLTPGRKEDR